MVLKGLDPVSLLEGKEEPGKVSLYSTRGKFRYLLATPAHKASFDAQPERFSVQSDRCSAMPTVPASPDLFLVHRGKILLFGSPGCLAAFKADPDSFSEGTDVRNVAMFIYQGMDLLDFAGPAEVFGIAGRPMRKFNVFTVASSAEPVEGMGFTLTPRYTSKTCPKVDVLVIPGGSQSSVIDDPVALDWLRKTSGEAEVVLSICTGAFVLAKLGLLDGLEATTHRESIDGLRTAAPKARILENRRFVDNGKIVTSAGVSSGIDASLRIVGRLLGPDAEKAAARTLEYRQMATETGENK